MGAAPLAAGQSKSAMAGMGPHTYINKAETQPPPALTKQSHLGALLYCFLRQR